MHYSSGKRGEIHRIRLESDLVDADFLDETLRSIRLDRDRYLAMLAIQEEQSDVLTGRGMEHVIRALEREHKAKPIIHAGRTVSWQLTMLGQTLLEGVIILMRSAPDPKPSHRASVLQMTQAVSKSA